MPLISIVIPCYRQAHFLTQAVGSVLGQSFQDVEAVIVDDGSPDDPLAHLGELAHDPRVIVIRQENRGVPAARNTGVIASSGEYLCFLDSDDWLTPVFCERLHPLLARDRSLGFAYCDLQRMYEGEVEPSDFEREYSVGRSRSVLSGNILPSLLVGGYFTPNTVLMPRQVLDRVGLFDTELGGNADWDLWLRVAASGFPVRYLDEKLAYYRIHGSNMSGNLEHMRTTRVLTLRKLFRAFPEAAAAAVGELCRTVEEQFVANRFLQAWIRSLEEAKSWHQSQAVRWQAEAERLAAQRPDERRFAEYFRETQAWIASLEEAKSWHESQAAHWQAEAKRLAAQRPEVLGRRGLAGVFSRLARRLASRD